MTCIVKASAVVSKLAVEESLVQQEPDLQTKLQGRVVQTPVNANLALKVNQGFCFSC